MNRTNVLTNSLKENGNGDVAARLTNIASEDKGMGTFKVIRNLRSFTKKNAFEILSILSTFVTHGLPSFRGHGANLQFGHLFN
jgi:hypothetical protein